jgi:hypothetical protein
MNIRNVQSILAIALVGIFVIITGFMAIFPLISKGAIDLGGYADYFVKTSSVYTGIIGVIIGYYFGKIKEDRPSINKNQANTEIQ